MLCPSCGKKPLRFTGFLSTVNPFRIACTHCGTRLRAGPVAYIWTLLHAVLGIGLAEGHKALKAAGMLSGSFGSLSFLLAAALLIFCTAFVIPWVWFNGAYRVAS